jgi:putative membrane protein
MIPGYASILHNHLKDEETSQQLFDGVDLEIDHHKHKPNQVKKCCFKKLMICMIQKITGDQLIILNEEVKSFTDICGACERIKHHYPLFLQRFP